jgi:AraC-like DNA-binding protein
MQIRIHPRLEKIPLAERSFLILRHYRGRRLDFNWHYHPEIELTLVKQGQGLRYVGHSIEPYAPGDLCLLGANLPHSWISATRLESVVVQFKADLFEGALGQLSEMDAVRRVLAESRRGLQLTGAFGYGIQERMQAMLKLPDGDSMRFLRLLEILVLIGAQTQQRYLSATDAIYTLRPEITRRLKRVVTYVQGNFREYLSHLQAAHIARLSPTAFSRFFRQHIGKTFEDYVNEVRIGHVCVELHQSDASITEIALRCGYQNLANFNRRFQERLHMTPREYRGMGAKASFSTGS